MSLNIQIFEEHGPAVNGRGTVSEVSEFNLSTSSSFGYPYYYAPLRRPLSNEDQTLSYQRYFFFRLYGNTGIVKNVKIQLLKGDALQATRTQLFYRASNVYQTPSNAYDGKMIYTKNEPVDWYPNLSSSGPTNATSRPLVLAPGSDVYTQYFIFQMRCNDGEWNDVGNTDEFKLKFSFIESI